MQSYALVLLMNFCGLKKSQKGLPSHDIAFQYQTGRRASSFLEFGRKRLPLVAKSPGATFLFGFL
jgi:hypothetical protein